jgi:hypothetical protein
LALQINVDSSGRSPADAHLTLSNSSDVKKSSTNRSDLRAIVSASHPSASEAGPTAQHPSPPLWLIDTPISDIGG